MTAADTIKDLSVEVKRCAECGARFGVEAAFCPFCGIPLTTSTWDPTRDPLVGTVVDGRYEVEAPLGEGGMGTVYRVRHVTLNRPFAMKVLHRDLAADADLAARFVQEARATAAIKHPSVVVITDFGDLDAGIPYFVMELLVGETLSTRMRARGPWEPADVIKIARQITEGLEPSHAANVIHRDLKPENVFLVGGSSGKRAEDDIRIVDFGAAKIIGASKMTRPGVVFGTPYYMSPEQASGQSVDPRADVYSLGILMYEMITGRVPFEADTYMGVLTKHMFSTPEALSQRVSPDLKLGELEDIVMRALAKDPAERPQDMGALVRLLDEAALARLLDEAASRVAGAPRTTGKMGRQLTTADKIQLSVRRHVADEARRTRRLVALGIVCACATIAVGAIGVTIYRGAEASPKADARASQANATATATPTPTGSGATAKAQPPPSASAPPSPGSSVAKEARPAPASSAAGSASAEARGTVASSASAGRDRPHLTPPPTRSTHTGPPNSAKPVGAESGDETSRRPRDGMKDPWAPADDPRKH